MTSLLFKWWIFEKFTSLTVFETLPEGITGKLLFLPKIRLHHSMTEAFLYKMTQQSHCFLNYYSNGPYLKKNVFLTIFVSVSEVFTGKLLFLPEIRLHHSIKEVLLCKITEQSHTWLRYYLYGTLLKNLLLRQFLNQFQKSLQEYYCFYRKFAYIIQWKKDFSINWRQNHMHVFIIIQMELFWKICFLNHF